MPDLSDIPNGANVFIDANCFYLRPKRTLPTVSRTIGTSSQRRRIWDYLLPPRQRATHKFMLAEFQARGGPGSGNPRKYLKEHPEIVAALTQYWIEAQKILAMNLVFLALADEIISAAHPIRKVSGLLNNDSLIAASMQYLGVTSIASNDADFGNVQGFSVFRPSDI